MNNQVNTITVELVDGTKVIVPNSLELITPYVLQEQGDWFEDEIKFLRKLVQPGHTVVDIGANYGVYALSLARKVGANGQLWAFEPATQTAELLSESARANNASWLHVVQQALSDRVGTAWLQMPGQAELNSLATSETVGTQNQHSPGEEVEVTTLDRCLEAYGWKTVDLLKIDAEGEEERILNGGSRFFRELSPLVMFEVKAGAEVHLHLVQHFQQLGYQCFRLIPGLDALAPFSSEQEVDGYLLNLFAAKPDRVAALAAGGWLVERAETDSLAAEAINPIPWLERLGEKAYAHGLIARWQSQVEQPEQTVISRALQAWAASHDESAPMESRYGALTHSLALLHQSCQPGCNPARWASLARVALASGERMQAVQALSSLVQDLQSGKSVDLDEPFLSPDPAFEVVEPTGPIEYWLEAAGLTALEQCGSFSSFYTGENSTSRLERVENLGYANGAMLRRIELLQQRHGRRTQEAEGGTAVKPWFDFLELREPLHCLDVGALSLQGEVEPWVRWAHEGCAKVLGFEPLKTECEQLNQHARARGAAIRYLPWALGDGKEHTLHITNAPMTSSLFPPARNTVDLFPALGELMQVEQQVQVQTHRLDDIEEAHGADFLKLDVQGAELMILQNSQKLLQSISVIQCEVEFIELYEGQPLMAEIDIFLRSQGFCFLRFTHLMGRPFKAIQEILGDQAPASNFLWADAVYIRDFRDMSAWSDRQLKAAAFTIHEAFQAYDVSFFLLKELDRRLGSDLTSCYSAALMLNQL